jgi:ATP adenylyltransferase
MSDNIIWAPWRAEFVLSKKEKGCILCNRFKMPDTVENLIVYRGTDCFVILNKFPYNSGHTMIVPNRHIANLEEMTETEAGEFFALTRRAIVAIKSTLDPHSLNIGMNLGEVSGAGIPEHLHMHVVPRWNGDTNFMPVIGKTNVVSVPLEPIYELLKKEFAAR